MNNASGLFAGRTAIIATKHQKERVIQPVLEERLSVHCFIPQDYDTDAWGTFCGSIARKEDPISTLRQKTLTAMDQYGMDLGVGSEGSFGPHPEAFFLPIDEEWLILIDKKNNLEIIAKHVSTCTNFGHSVCVSEAEVKDFAKRSGFPEHALIAKIAENSTSTLAKGLQDWQALLQLSLKTIQQHGRIHLETDMRACYNPKRMSVIAEATQKFVEKILRACPKCAAVGFDITRAIPGLPCTYCGIPTKSTKAYLMECLHCHHEETIDFPHNKTTENPMYCDYCNP